MNTPPPKLSDLNERFQEFLPSLLGFGGILLFIMLLSGGFKLLTSGGNPQSAAQARATITYAIIGLIIAASGYLILTVIKNITGANVTEFNIILNI